MTDEAPSRRLRGRCLCGALSYEVDDAFAYALICHCTDCQRATGAASKPFAGIAANRLTLVRGADRLKQFGEAHGHDARCDNCGSLLYSLVRDGGFVHVTLGTLVDPPTRRPGAHIFVRSLPPWDTICDDLPRFETFPPES